MVVLTEHVCAHLTAHGFTRDNSQPYDCAAYCCDSSGTFVVIDESISYQDTDMLIEDCVANQCYEGAALIKKWVKDKAKK
jgi:hypothetical protein